MKQETRGTVLELLLAENAGDESSRSREPSVAVGTLTGFDELGRPLVSLRGEAGEPPLHVRSILRLDESQVGREVVLAFAAADRQQPIVIGVLQESGAAKPQSTDVKPPGITPSLDGETLLLNAKREIVLRCGRASITLTRAGKILLRGAYLLSRSSGVNRIKGGSVQIN
jgi:hypothetical protein